jgi:hypothetical protein
VVGVSTISHSAQTSAVQSALAFWGGAAIISKLMASAAATSKYIALAGHALSLIIIYFLLDIVIQFMFALTRFD